MYRVHIYMNSTYHNIVLMQLYRKQHYAIKKAKDPEKMQIKHKRFDSMYTTIQQLSCSPRLHLYDEKYSIRDRSHRTRFSISMATFPWFFYFNMLDGRVFDV